jgi:NitT/TauT family transport system permease protein
MTARESALGSGLDARAATTRRRSSRRQSAARLVREWWPSAFGFIVFFAGWEIAVRVTGTPAFIVPPPSTVAGRFWTELPGLLYELSYTLTAASIGLAIGAAVGILGAIVMVQSRLLERSLFPIAVLIKLVPFVALAPLLIVWLGFDLKPKIFLAALITFFPVLVNCISGLRATDATTLDLFRSVGASRQETFRYLRWPTSLPFQFASLKITAHLAIVGASVGEYFGANHGIGVVILRTSERLQIGVLFSAALLMALLGIAIIMLTNFAERRLISWHESVRTSDERS